MNGMTADEIPALLGSEKFAGMPAPRRAELAERALNDAAGEFAGKWDKETYRKWGRFANKVRGKVSGMEGAGDAARHYGGVLLDASRGMARMGIAAAADAGVMNPDASLKAPFGNMAEQAGFWTRKAADTANQWWAGGDKDLDEELGALRAALDEGDFPLDDQEKLGEWLEERAGRLAERQRFFYDRVEGAGKYPEAFPETNGLLNPDHAALLSRYLTTRDPAAWDQLVKGIKRTPGRMQIESEQAESLERSPLVNFLSQSLGADYSEAMQGAGNPLLLALTAVPLARGAAGAATAGASRTAGEVARGFGVSAGIGAGLGVAETAVAEPNATWQDYKTAAKDMIAVGLGFHGAGEGIGALARKRAGTAPRPVEQPGRAEPARAEVAPEPVRAEVAPENPFAGRLGPEDVPPPPGAPAPAPAPPPAPAAQAGAAPAGRPAPADAPSAVLPPRATNTVEPRPDRRGRDTSARDEWDAAYGADRKGGRSHNDDGTPYQPTLHDEVMQQVAADTKGNSVVENIDALGVDAGIESGTAVRQLLNDGWVWDRKTKRMVDPQGRGETPAAALQRIREGGAAAPAAPAPAEATAGEVRDSSKRELIPGPTPEMMEFAERMQRELMESRRRREQEEAGTRMAPPPPPPPPPAPAPAAPAPADVTRGLEVRRQQARARAENEGLPPDQAGVLVEAGAERPAAEGVKDSPTTARGTEPGERAPTLAEVDLFGEPVRDPGPATSSIDGLQTVEIPLERLRLSRDVPQFKSDADAATGVVEPLAGRYERLGVAPIVVWERLDGSLEVISGRHRFDLAKRTGEQTIPGQIVREAEGFTREQAVMTDAELNIRDGQGKIKDYANYFRNAGIDAAEAAARGLRARAAGRAGWTIGTEGSEALFDLHANGRLSDAAAEAIARAAPRNEALQRVGADSVLQGQPIDVSVNLMRVVEMEAGRGVTPEQLDLFGADDSAMTAMREQARRAAMIQRDLREQVNAVLGASKRPEKAKAMGVDVKDPEAVRAKVAELRQELDRWESWPLHEDLRAQVRGELPRGAAKVTPEADGTLKVEIPREPVPEAAEGFSLETVSAETLAAEQAAAARKTKMQERQEKPLEGTAGEYGTPDMLDNTAGDMALFSQGERRAPTEARMAATAGAPAVRGPLPSAYGGQLPPATVAPWSGKVQTLHGIRRALLEAAGLPQAGLRRFTHALGLYKVKPETVRLKAINDIPVLAHEIGHAIHYRELSPNRGGPPADWGGRYDGELMPLGRPTSTPAYTPEMVRGEGVAEFTRLWLTDRAAARAQAPLFSAFWEGTLAQKNPKMAAALDAARERIADYVAMPAFEKAKAQVVFDAGAEQVSLSFPDRLRRSYAKWVNTIQPALDAVREAGRMDQGLAARAREVEMWMENHRGGWQSKAHADIFTHQTNLQGQRVGEGLATILKDIAPGDGEAFSTYLALKRAAEIEGAGKRSGFEQARLPAAEMRALEAKFERTRQKVLRWQENELRLLEDSGLLDAKSAAAMRAANKDYVPFYRLYEGVRGVSLGPDGKTGGGPGYVDLSSGIRRLKGSDRAIMDPLQSMMKNALMFRKVAEQNHVAVQFFDLMRELQGHGKFGEQARPKMQGRTVTHDQVVQKLIDEGVIKDASALPLDADLTLRLWEAMKRPDTASGEVIYFKDGKRQHWEMKNPLLLEALKTADADALRLGKFAGPTLTKALTMPTRVLRFGATGGPWFAIPNWVRDQLIAGSFSKTGYIPFVDGFRGIMEAFRKGDMYQRWVEAGGKFHGIQTGDMAYNALLQDVLPKERSALRAMKALANPRHWKEALQYAGQLTEEATRVQEFARGVGRGMSDMEAANASKVVTLNFARAGERGRIANMLIAFTNAKIQDLDMIARTHLDPKRRGEVMMKGLTYITAPSLMTWYLGKDDPVIQNLPDWRKNLFWNLNMGPVAKALGREEFVLSVPKPFLMGAIYGTSVERALDYATERDPNGMRKAFDNMLRQGPGDLNPLEMVGSIAGFRPALEVMTNHNFFQNRPVVPEQTGFLPKEQQYDTFTSETAKMLGKATGQSPMVIDHLIRGYFATAGKWGTDAIDWGMAKLGASDVPPPPSRDVMERWILNRFAGSPYAANAWVDRFYKASRDMEGLMRVWNKQADQMTTKDHANWWKQHGPEVMHYQRPVNLLTGRTGAGDVRKAAADLAELGRAMKEVQQSRTISPEMKRERMMELSRQRNVRAEAAFKDLFPEPVRRRHY